MIENPNLSEKLKIVKNSYQIFGFWETLLHVAIALLNAAVIYLMSIASRPDRFDEKYGTETNEFVAVDDSEISDDTVRKSAILYVPMREVVLRHMLSYLSSSLDVKEFSFIDLGCGKGRAILIALEYPFIEILGVEASPKHCKVAQSNIKQFLKVSNQVKCRNIQVRCEDASKTKFLNTGLIIYMYHPFGGELFRSVIDLIHTFYKKSNNNRVLLGYLGPIEECRQLEEHEGFIKLYEYQVLAYEYCWSLWECRTDKAINDKVVSSIAL